MDHGERRAARRAVGSRAIRGAIGSGGQYALAAARALLESSASSLGAREIVERSLNIAADICIYTNRNLVIEDLQKATA